METKRSFWRNRWYGIIGLLSSIIVFVVCICSICFWHKNITPEVFLGEYLKLIDWILLSISLAVFICSIVIIILSFFTSKYETWEFRQELAINDKIDKSRALKISIISFCISFASSLVLLIAFMVEPNKNNINIVSFKPWWFFALFVADLICLFISTIYFSKFLYLWSELIKFEKISAFMKQNENLKKENSNEVK